MFVPARRGAARAPDRALWLLLATAFTALLLALCAAAPLWAGPPSVRFDVTHTIACRDVTPPEFAEANPLEKLIEARIQVSALMPPGADREAIQLIYRVESLEGAWQVADYEPKTTLESDLEGNVALERKEEKSHSLGLTLSGDYAVKASGSGGIGNKTLSSLSYQMAPPMEAVVASGPIARGSGVYFKMRPSRRSTLEGSREFCVILRVPPCWRADYVWVFCEAWKVRPGGSHAADERSSRQNFLVALYLEGDEVAREAAAELVQSDLALRRLAAAQHDEIKRRSLPTLAHRLGAAMSLVTPHVPPDWLAQVVYHPASRPPPRIVAPLPDEVRLAAERFLAAKRQVHELGGWGMP